MVLTETPIATQLPCQHWDACVTMQTAGAPFQILPPDLVDAVEWPTHRLNQSRYAAIRLAADLRQFLIRGRSM